MPAAFYMAVSQTVMRVSATSTSDVGELLIKANAELVTEPDMGVFVTLFALELREANDNFSIVAGRLYYLAYHLEELEEGSQACKYLELLEHDRIDEMLTSFNRFVEEFHAGRKLQLQVSMKAVATMKSINAIFEGSDLQTVLDLSLFSGTSRLLIDFMSAVKGIELDIERTE
ncbi:MAG TPA: hypothetical protein VLH13_00245 [Methanomassiliicoccales archaeon]|nr:hypothetical protein [Methanomassiliicoccales archaeon]